MSLLVYPKRTVRAYGAPELNMGHNHRATQTNGDHSKTIVSGHLEFLLGSNLLEVTISTWRGLPKLGLGGAKDTVIIVHVRATVAGVLHVQRVIEKIQVLLHLRNMFCRVLLRI